MEPERPIEKLLRESAKQRREETKAPELHPATRRMLQGEVARKFGHAAPVRSFSTWLAAFWPRIAWGMGVFAVLAVGAWLVLPPFGSGPARLAKQGTSEEFKRQPQANEPANAPADGVQLSRRDVRSENQVAHVNSSDRKLTDEKLVRPPELAGAAKDVRELRTSTAPSAVPDAAWVQPQPGARDNFAGGAPARTAHGVSRDSEHANGVAQSASSSLQAVPPAGVGTILPSTSSPPKPMVAAGPSPTLRATTADGTQRSSSAAAISRNGLAMGGAKSDNPLITTSPAPAAATLELAAANEKSASTAAQSAFAAAAPSAPAPTYFYAEGAKKEAARQVQRFSRVENETKAKALSLDSAASSRAVLASFELQQVGNEVRIVDNDGSVYTGYVQPTVTGGSQSVVPLKEEAPGATRSFRSVNGSATGSSSSEAETLTPQNYFFRVSGTNRSLNRSVVFTASVAADAFRMNTVTNAVALRGAVRERAQLAAVPQTNTVKLRISGRAVLGDREQVDINAVSK